MRLKSYPKAIAQKQQEILIHDQHMRQVQATVNRVETEVEKAIAFNDQLKNELQRKVSKTELLQDPEYLAALTLSGLKTLRFCGQRKLRQLPESNSRYGRQAPSTQSE